MGWYQRRVHGEPDPHQTWGTEHSSSIVKIRAFNRSAVSKIFWGSRLHERNLEESNNGVLIINTNSPSLCLHRPQYHHTRRTYSFSIFANLIPRLPRPPKNRAPNSPEAHLHS